MQPHVLPGAHTAAVYLSHSARWGDALRSRTCLCEGMEPCTISSIMRISTRYGVSSAKLTSSEQCRSLPMPSMRPRRLNRGATLRALRPGAGSAASLPPTWKEERRAPTDQKAVSERGEGRGGAEWEPARALCALHMQ